LNSLQELFNIDAVGWKEITAAPEKLPERRDWEFVFSDTLNYNLKDSELRYAATISGDQVTVAAWVSHVGASNNGSAGFPFC